MILWHKLTSWSVWGGWAAIILGYMRCFKIPLKPLLFEAWATYYNISPAYRTAILSQAESRRTLGTPKLWPALQSMTGNAVILTLECTLTQIWPISKFCLKIFALEFCLSHCSIAVKRYHDLDNPLKGKHLIGPGLHLQKLNLLLWQSVVAHGSGAVAESYILICWTQNLGLA